MADVLSGVSLEISAEMELCNTGMDLLLSRSMILATLDSAEEDSQDQRSRILSLQKRFEYEIAAALSTLEDRKH